MSDLTSMSLLNGIQATGERADWERFYSIYAPLLDNWLRRRGVPVDLADDVRQEVLIKVNSEIRQFQHNGRPGAFRAWLRQITAHRLRTELRRKWRGPQQAGSDLISLAEELGDDDSQMARMWNKEHDAYLLERLLELITPEFQEKSLIAFRQVVLEGREADAVAAELGLTINAVRIAQSRVLAALRRVGEGLLD